MQLLHEIKVVFVATIKGVTISPVMGPAADCKVYNRQEHIEEIAGLKQRPYSEATAFSDREIRSKQF